MKFLIMITAFTFSAALANAQAKSAGADTVKSNSSASSIHANKASGKGVKKNGRKLPAGTAIRGGKVVPLHHGKHDYTPGSPIGTGGAGGTMNGSQQGSASENAIGNKSSDELLKKNNDTSKNGQQTNKKVQ